MIGSILRAAPLVLAVSTAVVADRPPEANSAVQECAASNEDEDGTCTDASPSSVYVIGDLHGDATCATSWVNTTGLVANMIDDTLSDSLPIYERLKDPSMWQWTNDNAKLVFMGDYVDKGPTSKQTVELVRNLTLAFPDQVTGILGNHELELLKDRDQRIQPVNRYSAYSYATVHPGEYHNYFGSKHVKKNDADSMEEDAAKAEPRSLDDKDELVLDLLHEAAMEVYNYRAHSAVRFVPSLSQHTDDHQRRGIRYAITDIIPPEHRLLAQERLGEYIDAYLDAYRTGTVLGDWMEKRPVVHLAEDVKTLFVHGGVSSEIGKSYFSMGKEGVERLNEVWWNHSHEKKLYNFLHDDDVGSAVYELLTYRGNHPGYSKWESHGEYEDDPNDQAIVCKTLHEMLSHMDGVERIAVGHTPDDNIRILCDGAFLALDSTLGRWIRGSGNEYCPGPEHIESRKEKGVDVPRTSREGKYRCDEIKEVCEGQIVRLDSDGSVHLITM